MSWIKIDDQFADHPKIVSIGPLAGWLHVVALTYCGRYLTDGFVPYAMIPRLADFSGISVAQGDTSSLANAKQMVERLLGAGLWVACDGGYQIHDYLEYNPSKEQALATKDARVEAGRRGGLAKQAKPKQTPSKTLAKSKQKSAPSPSPVPSIPTEVAEKPAAKPRKAKQPNPNDPKPQMMAVFLKVTRLEMPTLKSDIGFWWSQMGQILAIANKDPTVGMRLIEETVSQMKQDQLTISSPKSLLNVARAIAAKRRRCEPAEIRPGAREVMPL